MFGEAFVVRVVPWRCRQDTQSIDVLFVDAFAQLHVGVVEPTALLHGLREQVDHLLWEAGGRSGVFIQESASTPQRMIEALLMASLLETLIGGESIVRHAPRPVDADDFFQDVGTALRVDGVECGSIITDPGVEPGGVSSDTPTGFIGSQMFGVDDDFLDLLISRLEFAAAPQDNLVIAAKVVSRRLGAGGVGKRAGVIGLAIQAVGDGRTKADGIGNGCVSVRPSQLTWIRCARASAQPQRAKIFRGGVANGRDATNILDPA